MSECDSPAFTSAPYSRWDRFSHWAVPHFSFQRPYELESAYEGGGMTVGWVLSVEWLSMTLSISGGIFRSGEWWDRRERSQLDPDAATGCADDHTWAGVPVDALRQHLGEPQTVPRQALSDLHDIAFAYLQTTESPECPNPVEPWELDGALDQARRVLWP